MDLWETSIKREFWDTNKLVKSFLSLPYTQVGPAYGGTFYNMALLW